MNIAIIDDSELFRNKIREIIEQDYPKEDISDFESIKDYENTETTYDLLLLDIELSDENGIEYIKNHPKKHKYVIYVTSYPEYMIEAFHMNVMGFVPKERMEELLLDKIHEVEMLISHTKKHCFHTIDGDVFIEEQRILCIFYTANTVCIQLENEKSPIYLMVRSLNEIARILSNDFYKINRTYIVNMKKIRQLIKDTHEVLMPGNEKIKVSDHAWVKFKSAYQTSRYHHD